MTAIERDNRALRDVLPKDYARPALDKTRLGQVVDMVSNIKVGGAEARATDVLGGVYEYFLEQFALAEGRKGGEFYTPRSVVRLLVEMLEPYQGRVYDPCCGSSGMFIQSMEFIRAHATGNGNGGRARGDISIYGQESNYTTWRMARMNLAIRGIEGRIEHGDSFHNVRHPDLRADYILANPPFNVSDWGGERLRDDRRWEYGVPPKGNANFAWVQHFLHHLAPRGIAGFVLANGSMSSNQSGEGDIRKNIIEAGLVDCIVALPGQLFRSTQIPACLWFLRRGRAADGGEGRPGETLFIDARKLGHMIDRTRRDLSQEDIARVADAYHAWRNQTPSPSSPSPSQAGTPSPLKGEGWGEGERADAPTPPTGSSGAQTPDEPTPPQGGSDGTAPPGAWTPERARAYLAGMDQEIVDLFPDGLAPSELGEIPAGWGVKALDQLVELNPREPMKRRTPAPYINMAALPISGPNPDAPVSREFTSGTRFRNGDTLLARITPCLENGKTAFVQSLPAGTLGWDSTEFVVMRATPPVPPEYTYLLARDAAFREHAVQNMTGTSGRQRVQIDALASYVLPCPPAEIWAEFSSLAGPAFARVESNRKEAHAIAAQRDALLPKLVSGEVGVGDLPKREAGLASVWRASSVIDLDARQ